MISLVFNLLVLGGLFYIVDRQKKVQPVLRWAHAGGRYLIQYQTAFELWLPYRGGGQFISAEAADEFISNELSRISDENKDFYGPTRHSS